jgi:hypothetical protein
MRSIFRRYRQLSAPQKRLYSLVAVVTLIALLLYCLGLGGLLLRSRLVGDVALELPPTFTATPSPQSTVVATPGPTRTPTATLPPTPTQRPIPTLTPTPESVNITVVITSTVGLTSTMVISATVTPTPVLTPTVTITAEASLGASYVSGPSVPEFELPMRQGSDGWVHPPGLVAQLHAEVSDAVFLRGSGQDTGPARYLVNGPYRATTRREMVAQSPHYG